MRVQKSIRRIQIKGLFGLYDHELSPNAPEKNILILYGENGTGKSTILNLVYHLLSVSDNRGHRNALYKGLYDYLEIEFSDGFRLTARRTKTRDAILLRLQILERSYEIARWDFIPKSPDKEKSDEVLFLDHGEFASNVESEESIVSTKKTSDRSARHGEKAYLAVLSEIAPAVFFLTAHRRLLSDITSLNQRKIEFEYSRISEELLKLRRGDAAEEAREDALEQALADASEWVRKKALQGTNQGSLDVHAVYVEIVQKLTTEPYMFDELSEISEGFDHLNKDLEEIDAKTAELQKYELATHLDTRELREALVASDKGGALAGRLLESYVRSVKTRINAVEQTYQLIDQFVSLVNSFFRMKKILYTVSSGFSIISENGASLQPKALSSGEKQLLLLFCSVLSHRDTPSVFIVDEPEISLNIKWQRSLLQALSSITKNAEVQFLFASHSIELLAQHLDCVVRLKVPGTPESIDHSVLVDK